MDELNAAAPSTSEPAADAAPMTGADLAEMPDWVKNGQPPAQEAGTAAPGESNAAAPDAGAASDLSAPSGSAGTAPLTDSQAPADVGGGVDAPSHLLMLDAMLAEIERKIGAGIHLFAHEVTAARDHLAKLL